MLLKPLSVAALVAASASNAFLIPPEISPEDIEAYLADIPAPKIAPVDPSEKVVVELDCPGCPMPYGVTADSPSHLELTFTIAQTGSNDRLLVNGFELYPSADPFQTLAASQVGEARGDGHGLGLPLQRLGYSLQARPVARDEVRELELVMVDLQVIEVGDVFVKNIPGVRVKVVKVDGEGQMWIGGVEMVASQTPTSGEGEECETLMCKWIAFAKGKMREMKSKVGGCHGMGKGNATTVGNGNKGVGHGTFGDDRGMLHHGHPGHGHGHGNHALSGGPWMHDAQPKHTFGKLFKNIFVHVLMPVFIGIVAGVSVSL